MHINIAVEIVKQHARLSNLDVNRTFAGGVISDNLLRSTANTIYAT